METRRDASDGRLNELENLASILLRPIQAGSRTHDTKRAVIKCQHIPVDRVNIPVDRVRVFLCYMYPVTRFCVCSFPSSNVPVGKSLGCSAFHQPESARVGGFSLFQFQRIQAE